MDAPMDPIEHAVQPVDETQLHGCEINKKARANDQPRTAKTIEDLPQELLVQIVKSVASCKGVGMEQERGNWYNLCLIKPFNPAATELLYENKFGPHIHDTNNCCLLRTMVQNPKLAVLVKNITMFHSDMRLMNQDAQRKMSREDVNILRNALIEGFGLEDLQDQKKWTVYFDSGKLVYALGALLLRDTPNVESMEFSGHDYSGLLYRSFNPSSWATIQAGQSKHSTAELCLTYSHLRRVSMYVSLMTQIVSLMKLPAIEDLTVHCISAWDQTSTQMRGKDVLTESSSSVKFLSIVDSALREDCLSFLIDACRALEMFTYRQDGYILPQGTSSGFAKVGNAFKKHKNTLCGLIILDTISEEGYHTQIGSLSNLEVLKYLKIDAEILFPRENPPTHRLSRLLPATVQDVRIFNSWPSSLQKGSAGLWELTKPDSEHTLLPQLKFFGIECDPWEDSAVESFKKAWCRDTKLKILDQGVLEYAVETEWH